MDPFAEETNDNTTLSNPVEIWVETNGRRKNTYISGLPFDEKEMKEHLKNLKKKHGCNGSLKEVMVESTPVETLHLQGDHVDNIIDYFKQHKINDIKVRG